MSRLLELGGEHLPGLHRGDGEGDHRGGHVQIQEGAGHGVLAADGRHAQAQGEQGQELAPPTAVEEQGQIQGQEHLQLLGKIIGVVEEGVHPARHAGVDAHVLLGRDDIHADITW